MEMLTLNTQKTIPNNPEGPCAYQKSPVKYTYWRGRTLYLRLQPRSPYNPGDIEVKQRIAKRHSNSQTEFRACYKIAEDVLAKYRTQVSDGTFNLNPKKVPNPKIWRLVLVYMRYGFSKIKNQDAVKTHLRYILAKFGRRYAKDISTGEWNEWFSSRLKSFMVNSVKCTRNYAKRLYNNWNECVSDNDYKLRNPVDDTRSLGRGNIRNYFLDKDKFARYCKIAYEISRKFGSFWKACWLLGGRRPQEVAEYCWEMIKFEGEKPFIDFHAAVQNNKTHDDRIPIVDSLWAELLNLYPEGERFGRIFKTDKGQNWMGVRGNRWQPFINKLRARTGDPEIWCRDTRRGFTTECLDAGNPAPVVMSATGHRDPGNLNRYYSQQLQAKVRAIESTLGAGTK